MRPFYPVRMTCTTNGMTAIRGSTWIQRLGISKTNHPMIHTVSSRPEETASTELTEAPGAGRRLDIRHGRRLRAHGSDARSAGDDVNVFVWPAHHEATKDAKHTKPFEPIIIRDLRALRDFVINSRENGIESCATLLTRRIIGSPTPRRATRAAGSPPDAGARSTAAPIQT